MHESSKETLADLQAWFGRSISQPLPNAYPGNPLVVSNPELKPDADLRLKGTGDLSGFSRLGIYNQQYWFRLISIMQSEYTCTVHAMGLKTFNNWVIQYLQSYPPSSPFLAHLDAAFPAFLAANYYERNRSSTLQSVAFDRAYSQAFDAPNGMALSALGTLDLNEIWTRALQLAPDVTVLHLDYDLSSYREACRHDESLLEEYALQPVDINLVVYRNQQLEVCAEPVSKVVLAVLQEFEEPTLLATAFERLNSRLTSTEHIQLEQSVGSWFQNWVEHGWLCAPL